MNLAEKYALECGVKLREPFVDVHFFPLNFDKYVLFDTRGKVESFKYDLFSEVLEICGKSLRINGYEIIQLMEEKDQKLPAGAKGFAALNKKQEAYLVKNSDLVIANDNYSLQLASILKKKSIGLYSCFYAENVRPAWNKELQTIFESHRFGNKPGYGAVEIPKTINLIKPEQVCCSIFDNLGISHSFDKVQTLHIGAEFHQKVIEIVPDFITEESFLQGKAVNLRVDYCKDLDLRIAAFWAKGRSVNILTNRDIDLDLFRAFKSNILCVTIEMSDDISESFLQEIKKMGLNLKIYCDDKERLSEFRFKFFDWTILQEDFKKMEDSWEPESITDKCKFKSSKILISQGKKYACKNFFNKGIPLDKHDQYVSLDPEFFEELDYYKIYKERD